VQKKNYKKKFTKKIYTNITLQMGLRVNHDKYNHYDGYELSLCIPTTPPKSSPPIFFAAKIQNKLEGLA